jgi:hypothetical protein
MGYDLSNKRGESVRFSAPGWSLALETAERSGWEPAGTLAPAGFESDSAWSGDYFAIQGQRVSTTDAAALVVALERALADGEFAAKTQEAFNELQDGAAKAHPRYKRIVYSLEDALAFADRIRELIAVARGDGFAIR